MTELRVYLPIYDLQPQFAAWLSTPLRARGYPPFEGQHSLIIEVAPALAVPHLYVLVAPDRLQVLCFDNGDLAFVGAGPIAGALAVAVAG